MSNGNFPGKKKGGRSTIITPRTAQDMLTSGMPRRTREVRETLEQQLPLHIGGEDLVESADRITWTPAEQASALDFKVARLYLRVSTDEQDLQRQERIEEEARRAGYYVAGVYREKASGARADRPELLRMIDDLQPGEVVVAEKIDGVAGGTWGELFNIPLTAHFLGGAAIGDSPEHDIAGAAGANLDSVLLRTGILSDKDDASLQARLPKGARHVFSLAELRW